MINDERKTPRLLTKRGIQFFQQPELVFKTKHKKNTLTYVSTIFCIEKAGTKLVKRVLL